jgi:acyl-CoA synthetase (AMP-forming)/AMP-acid ligase II
VQVQGPNVIDRYMHAPAIDEPARVVAGPSAAASAFVAPGTFVTGDYASRDAAGVYVLTGRVASFVNVAGRKVHPQEVEAALRRLPGVSDAVALAIDDPVRGQALAACLVSARPWDARTVREALSARMAAWKLPRVVIVVPNLPLTDRGKVDRIAIARRLGEA